MGSNATSQYGDPVKTVLAALEALDGGPSRVRARSRLYRTPFVPAGGGPDVINAAARVETELPPAVFLEHLHAIEAEFGRERQARWGSRTLDLDLIAANGLILPDRDTFATWLAMTPADQRTTAPDELILPHPRMQDRAFVLVPAAEVDPTWRHPVLGRTIIELLAALPAEDVAAVRAIAD